MLIDFIQEETNYNTICDVTTSLLFITSQKEVRLFILYIQLI